MPTRRVKGVLRVVAESMTGYGRAQVEQNGRKVAIEIKSVNHRFLEVNVKSSSRLFSLDEIVKKIIRERFHRGYFDAALTLSSEVDYTAAVSINESLLAGYLDAAKTMSKKFGVSSSPGVGDLFGLKDIFVISDRELVVDDWLSMIEKAVNMALDQVDRIRGIEGTNALKDIRARFSMISQWLAQIEKLQTESVGARYERLVTKIKNLVSDGEIDENRIAQEAAILADRADVSEELNRIKSHLEQVKKLLDSGGPVGRKLEFFLQELNRETNTIGSKTASADGTARVVDIKSELEKIREQAQNLE